MIDVGREQLDAVVAALKDGRDDWPEARAAWFESSLHAFTDMFDRDDFPLTDPQAAWVTAVADALELDLPEALRGPVPRGKPVSLLVDKMARPTAPPGRKK